jgi:nitroreductase
MERSTVRPIKYRRQDTLKDCISINDQGSGGKHSLDEEAFELTETGELWQDSTSAGYKVRTRYQDGASIDWLREEALEREQRQRMSSVSVIRGSWIPSMTMWLIVVATGIGIGVTGAWLDVLVQWHVLTWLKYYHEICINS